MEQKITFSVAGPNRFRKYKALQEQLNKVFDETRGITNAIIRWLSSMSFFEITPKYEMLIKKYSAVAEIKARGAARLMVRTGSRTSESTELMLAYPMKDLEKVRR